MAARAQEEAFRALRRAIRTYSGVGTSAAVEAAIQAHRNDPGIDIRTLTAWLWTVMEEVAPFAFIRAPAEHHTFVGMATLYSLRSAPSTVTRVQLSLSERRSMQSVRRRIAVMAALPSLVRRRWRHLVAESGSPIDLTFVAAEPQIGGGALCWERGLTQTAVYPAETIKSYREDDNLPGLLAACIHEEMHLALSLEAPARPDLTPLMYAAFELASDAAQTIAFSDLHGETASVAEKARRLHELRRPSACFFDRMSPRATIAEALRAMVEISRAATVSDQAVLAAARRHCGGRLPQAELARMLGQD